MHYSSHSNKGGFTLAEVLMVVAVIALLGVVALSSLVQTSDTFNFLSNFKNVQSSLVTARNFAVTNAQINDGGNMVDVDRYGIVMANNYIRVFADLGEPYEIDGSEVFLADKDFSFDTNEYMLMPLDSACNKLTLPVEVYYDRGTGEFTVFEDTKNAAGPTLVSKEFDKFISLYFEEQDDDPLERFLVIFQVAGLPEEFTESPC